MKKTLNLPAQYRSSEIQVRAEPDGKKIYELSISSENPVERWWGVEILDHGPGSVRLDRFSGIGLPMLVDHVTGDQVGLVESPRLAERKLLGEARFGRSARAAEIQQDVDDAIRRTVSVGYVVKKMVLEKEENGIDTYRILDWEPLEVSLVPVPADHTVGIGRSAEEANPVEIITAERSADKEERMETNPEQAVTTPAVSVAPNNKDVLEILEICRTQNCPGEAEAFIRAGKTPDQVGRELLGRRVSNPLPQPAAEQCIVPLNKRESKQYSYMRAVRHLLTGESCFEAEISRECESKIPASVQRHGGIFVPLRLNPDGKRAILDTATGTAASELVFTQPGELIELLRNESVCMRLGARTLVGLKGPVTFPKQTGAATISWTAENPGSDVAAANLATGSVTLTPNTAIGRQDFTRQLLYESTPDLEQMCRQDMILGHALAWDAAGLHGAGGTAPTGVYSAADVNSVAMGGVPTFSKLQNMVVEVAKDNALRGSLGWATTPGMAGVLSTTPRHATADAGGLIWQGSLTDGIVNGYQAIQSNQVSSTLGGGSEHGIVFGNWNEMVFGFWGALEIVLDQTTLAAQAAIRIISFQMADMVLRHGQSFCKATGATIS